MDKSNFQSQSADAHSAQLMRPFHTLPLSLTISPSLPRALYNFRMLSWFTHRLGSPTANLELRGTQETCQAFPLRSPRSPVVSPRPKHGTQPIGSVSSFGHAWLLSPSAGIASPRVGTAHFARKRRRIDSGTYPSYFTHVSLSPFVQLALFDSHSSQFTPPSLHTRTKPPSRRMLDLHLGRHSASPFLTYQAIFARTTRFPVGNME
jgi:hypothetical protein